MIVAVGTQEVMVECLDPFVKGGQVIELELHAKELHPGTKVKITIVERNGRDDQPHSTYDRKLAMATMTKSFVRWTRFLQSKSYISDVGAVLKDSALEGYPGFIYLDVLYIGLSSDSKRAHLILGNMVWNEPIEHIRRLESQLFDWAESEGYFDE